MRCAHLHFARSKSPAVTIHGLLSYLHPWKTEFSAPLGHELKTKTIFWWPHDFGIQNGLTFYFNFAPLTKPGGQERNTYYLLTLPLSQSSQTVNFSYLAGYLRPFPLQEVELLMKVTFIKTSLSRVKILRTEARVFICKLASAPKTG